MEARTSGHRTSYRIHFPGKLSENALRRWPWRRSGSPRVADSRVAYPTAGNETRPLAKFRPGGTWLAPLFLITCVFDARGTKNILAIRPIEI
jgi:hypothetical protein